jgi:hypothetical protein
MKRISADAHLPKRVIAQLFPMIFDLEDVRHLPGKQRSLGFIEILRNTSPESPRLLQIASNAS